MGSRAEIQITLSTVLLHTSLEMKSPPVILDYIFIMKTDSTKISRNNGKTSLLVAFSMPYTFAL